MTPDERPAFNREMLAVASVMRHRTLSDQDLARYWHHLNRYELHEVRSSLTECEGALEFFPVPVQIIERIKSSRRATERPSVRPEISDEERAHIRGQLRGMIEQLGEKMRLPEDTA